MKHPQITFFAGVKYFLILHFLLTAFSSQAWISFTMSVHKGCYPLEVEFTNTSTEGKTFDWDFGDGTYFTGTDTSHIYTEPGVYTVTMHAYDQNGWYIWYAESQVIVWGNIGFFEMTKEDLCPNEPVSFDPLLDTVICHWDFGDGRFSTDKYPVHYYQDPGLYIVRLTGMTPCDTAVIIDSVYIRDDDPLQGHLKMVL